MVRAYRSLHVDSIMPVRIILEGSWDLVSTCDWSWLSAVWRGKERERERETETERDREREREIE